MHRVVLVLAVAACSQPAQPSRATSAPAVAETSTAGDIAPSLFTVEQLRAGNPPGRVIEYRAEAEGKPAKLEYLEFVAATPDEATIHSITKDETGAVLADQSSTAKWIDLHKHGQFPAAATTIEDNVELTVPAGTFKTRLYTVKDGDTTKRYWFAVDLPGPPIQFTTERAGKLVQRAQMLRAR